MAGPAPSSDAVAEMPVAAVHESDGAAVRSRQAPSHPRARWRPFPASRSSSDPTAARHLYLRGGGGPPTPVASRGVRERPRARVDRDQLEAHAAPRGLHVDALAGAASGEGGAD